jgi:hypothetical protein
MRRARKHDNVLSGRAGEVSSGSRQGKEGCQVVTEGQTPARLAAFLRRSEFCVRGPSMPAATMPYFAPSGATILRFAAESSQDQTIAGAGDWRAPRGSGCREPGLRVRKRRSEEGSRVGSADQAERRRVMKRPAIDWYRRISKCRPAERP